MTVGFRITDNTTTVDLNDGADIDLVALSLGHGDPSAVEVDGTFHVRIYGGKANLRTQTEAIEQLLQQAIDYNRRSKGARIVDAQDVPVYLEYRVDDTEDWYRSPLTMVEYDIPQRSQMQLSYECGEIEFIVDFMRKNYWEGAEAQLDLDNPNGTDNTSGLAIYNCNDGAAEGYDNRHNYVDIDGADVGGNLPAATRLEITNTYASGRTGRVRIGHNFTNPDTFDHWLEAEDGTGGSGQASGDASGGTYQQVTLNDSVESDLITWTISSAQISAAAGRYFKFLARFVGSGDWTNARYRLRIEWNSTTIWETDLVTIDTNYGYIIRDLGTFRLPPWLAGLSSLDGFDLVLRGYQTTGSPITINIDAIQLTPVDGWRPLRDIGYGTAQNSRIVDDGIDDDLYRDDGAGSDKVGIYVGYGQPIMLQPGADQRLYFLMSSKSAYTEEIDRSATIKLYYRPRRLSI